MTSRSSAMGRETYRDLIVSRLGHAARLADPTVPLLAAVIAMLADHRV